MKDKLGWILIFGFCSAVFGSGCGDSSDEGSEQGADGGMDGGTDSGTGTDADIDGDAGTGTDWDTSPGTGSDTEPDTATVPDTSGDTDGTGGTDTDSDTGCTEGPCCDIATSTYKSSSVQCDNRTEYRCTDTECGADAQQRAVIQYCSGSSAPCDGAELGSWAVIESCDVNSVCQSDGTTGAECSPCAHGCSQGACWPECNPATDTCCDADGTSCDHGCDGTDCWPECNPASDTCCDEEGKWKTAEVAQPGTKLVWQRCPLGQTWSLGSCKCTARAGSSGLTLNWCEATGYADGTTSCASPSTDDDICETELGGGFRLPTNSEFAALLGGISCGSYQSTCSAMFGDDMSWYWSSTNFTTTDAYTMKFDTGHNLTQEKTVDHNIRCVRSTP